jgi:SAM-dependent methyltransferase
MSSSWFEEALRCPKDLSSLTERGSSLVCEHEHSYPVVDGVPVLLRDDGPQTFWVASASLAAAKSPAPAPDSPEAYRIETLGISSEQMTELRALIARGSAIDPVVTMLVGATNGILYKNLIGKLASYPIPNLRLPGSKGERLLDVGCSWGRWSLAAARKGYDVIGIDPSLGAVLTAQRVARSLGLSARFVCADARYLPFAADSFDVAFSYSVLQHFSKEHARQALTSIRNVLRDGGTALIQMPNEAGVRCLYHQARRGFREATDFDVRYWSTRELKSCFEATFGSAQLETDCFFGLGLQASDAQLMSRPTKLLLGCSEALRAASTQLAPLTLLADSVYVRANASRAR